MATPGGSAAHTRSSTDRAQRSTAAAISRFIAGQTVRGCTFATSGTPIGHRLLQPLRASSNHASSIEDVSSEATDTAEGKDSDGELFSWHFRQSAPAGLLLAHMHFPM